MRGAHSVKSGGKGKVVAIVIVVLVVLALAAAAVYTFVLGNRDWLPFLQQEQVASVEQDQEKSDDVTIADASQSTSSPVQDASSSSASATPGIYVNARFGFELAVPQGFVVGSELPEGEGVTLTNSALRMTVNASGYNNTSGLTADAILASLWNGSEDSIARAEGTRVIIYQYDTEYEYFYWVNVGSGSVDQLEIRYPLQDDNRDELDAAQELMSGFIPGNLDATH